MADLAATLRALERVGLDTSIFIYHIEASTRYAELAGAAFRELEAGSFAGVTSVLTLMELCVRPLQLGRSEVADEYEVLVAGYPNLSVVVVDRSVARRGAELRAAYRLRPADALQVAACLERGATAFLTNDRAIARVREFQVLLLEDFLEG